MTMQITTQLLAEKVKQKFLGEGTGHDWYHLERVWKLAKYIAEQEGKPADSLVVEAAALTHDIGDWKFIGQGENQAELIRKFLQDIPGFSTEQIDHICRIAGEISFKGSGVADVMSSYEGEIVQDADRLDALGAIGIARTFAYGGSVHSPIYDPNLPVIEHRSAEEYASSRGSSINHFYEKLLLLKDRLHTSTARRIGQQRHEYMEKFLEQFFAEWEVKV